jgi:hypothetical protein
MRTTFRATAVAETEYPLRRVISVVTPEYVSDDSDRRNMMIEKYMGSSKCRIVFTINNSSSDLHAYLNRERNAIAVT